jgi:hypothetical protein
VAINSRLACKVAVNWTDRKAARRGSGRTLLRSGVGNEFKSCVKIWYSLLIKILWPEVRGA